MGRTANRRDVLKMAGATAALGGAAGGLGSVSAAPDLTEGPVTIDGFEFDTVVNVVEDLNFDRSGNNRIDSKLSNAAANNTLLVFPDGTYRMGSVNLSGLENFGMIADNGAAPTIRATDDVGRSWLRFEGGRNILVQGFEFDMTGDGIGGTLNMQMDGSWVLRDVQKLGTHPDRHGGFRLAVHDSGATGLAERCIARDGAADGDGSVGMYAPSAHAGELIIRDCILENFTNNGIYASGPNLGGDGPVKVERGLYRNNNISGVRLGSSGSYARGVVIVNDEQAPAHTSSVNQRGFYIRQGGDNIQIENCDVAHTYENASVPVVIGSAATGGGTVTDCRIQNESGNRTVHLNDQVADGWSGSGNHLTGSGNRSAPSDWVSCSGSSCDLPRTTPREMSYEDDGQSTPESGSEGGDLPDVDPHMVTFISTADAGEASYEFTAGGPVVPLEESPYTSPSGNEVRATSNFSIDSEGETHNVSGSTGNGYGDAFEVYGQITDVTVANPDWMWIELEAEEVSEDEVVARTAPEGTDTGGDAGGDTLPNTIVIDGSHSSSSSTYALEVSGDLAINESETSAPEGASGWDSVASSVSGGKVLGVVRDGKDGFDFSGDIVSLQIAGNADVQIDRE